MRNWTLLSILLLLLAVFTGTPVNARAQDIGLQVGATPTAVTVPDLEGQPVDFAQFVGKKPVVLEFWATWCPLCQQLEPMLSAAHKKYGSSVEFVIVGVGVSQTPRSIKRHLEKHPMPGRFVFDQEGKAVRAFMAPSTSYIVVLDGKGRVAYTGSGAEQKLDPVLAKVARP
jgi:thiol-disulfide isomerase/thioredoxin